MSPNSVSQFRRFTIFGSNTSDWKAEPDDISMPRLQTGDSVLGNELLGALEPASRARIIPHLERIKLKLGALVCEAGGILKHAYFPQGSVLSLLTLLENGSAIETANIGREGAFGCHSACNIDPLSRGIGVQN